MTNKIIAATALALALPNIASPAFAEKPVELSPAQLTAAQSRTYSISAGTAFSASIATLQTLGYVDINASKDAGTISAQTEAKGKIFYNILWGFGKKKLTQKASLLVEDNGPGQSLVRLNLHVTETKARGIFGTSFSDGKLVKVAEPYDNFFAALNAEVARRSTTASSPAIAAPATSGSTAVPAAAPAIPATTSNPQ